MCCHPIIPVWKADLHIREDLKASMRVNPRVSGQESFHIFSDQEACIELFQWMFLPPLRIRGTVTHSQVALWKYCWLSGIGASYDQSWPSQIWRFSAVPDWNDSFSGCMLLSGYPGSYFQTLRLCWQYRCVHWLIVTGTCSTPNIMNCKKCRGNPCNLRS